MYHTHTLHVASPAQKDEKGVTSVSASTGEAKRVHPKPCCGEWEEGGCWQTGLTGLGLYWPLRFADAPDILVRQYFSY